mgnify:CR=1 FL=1
MTVETSLTCQRAAGRRRAACAALALAGMLTGMLAGAPAAQAAPGDTGTASASAEIAVVTPLVLIKMADLNFGKVATQASAGTVAIDPNTSTCTTTGGLVHAGACQAAGFGGMGTRNMYVRINVPASVSLTGPGASMVLDTLTLDTTPDFTIQGSGSNRRYRIITQTGIFNFNLGGTLHVNAAQAPGTYAGTFTVQVQYQ